jgi:hypothetical protein
MFKLHNGCPQNVQTALAGRIGNNVDFFHRHFSIRYMIPERGYDACYTVRRGNTGNDEKKMFDGALLVRMTITKLKQPVNGKGGP